MPRLLHRLNPMAAILFAVFGLLFLPACEEDTVLPEFTITGQPILDEYGRTLILRGLNTSSSAKAHPERLPWITEADVEREALDFGFNFVRYLIFWDAVEPEPGQYDEAYLDKVAERVDWYAAQGMYVMLDMHQDLYSIAFGGDGAPYWALQTDGHEFAGTGGPWWLANIDPAVIACWTNFWEYSDHQYLQNHYIAMWQRVAERFRDHPYVLGYDLMNEPWGGDAIKTVVTGDFERYQLSAFYNRLIPALRETDPDAWIFFEPTPAPVTFGAKSRLPAIRDTRPDSRLAYAPHCYPYDTHEGAGYTLGSKAQLKDWERERKAEVKKHGNIPLLCGEFGLSPDQAGFDEYLTDVLGLFDRYGWHWTYWSNDRGGWSPYNADGSQTAIAPYLMRAYPRATSGALRYFHHEWPAGDFTLYFEPQETGMPTEIFLPRSSFSNGWDIHVEGAGDWRTEWDETRQILRLWVDGSDEVVQVVVKGT